jgi:hypothetical protein
MALVTKTLLLHIMKRKGGEIMQYEESYTQFDVGLLELIKRAIPASFENAMKAGGSELVFPLEREIELKLKYDTSEAGGKFTLILSWDNELGDYEEDDEED